LRGFASYTPRRTRTTRTTHRIDADDATGASTPARRAVAARQRQVNGRKDFLHADVEERLEARRFDVCRHHVGIERMAPTFDASPSCATVKYVATRKKKAHRSALLFRHRVEADQ